MKILLIVALLLSSNIASSDLKYLLNPIKETEVASRSKRVRPNRNASHKYQCGRPYCLYTGNLLNDMCKHVGACWGTKWGCRTCGFRVTSPWVIKRHRQLHKGEEANTLVPTRTKARVLYKCTLGKQIFEYTLPTCNVERHEVAKYYLMIHCVSPGCTYKGDSLDMSKHEKYCTGRELGCTGCNYTVDSEQLMKEHLQVHYVERMVFSQS